MNLFDDDADFTYSSEAEIDRADAYDIGAAHPERAWISSGRDVWYPNPYYRGLPVPHPEDDYAWDQAEMEREARQKADINRRVIRDAKGPDFEFDDLPF